MLQTPNLSFSFQTVLSIFNLLAQRRLMVRLILLRLAEGRPAICAGFPGRVYLLTTGGTIRRSQAHAATGTEGISLLQGKSAMRAPSHGRGYDSRSSRLRSGLMPIMIHRRVH